MAKRRYNSARRQEAARETHRQILEAARRLFLERGYAGTTMNAIAQDAGVAVETVYVAFKNKRTVLARLVDVQVVGDDKPIPLLERPEPRQVLHESDRHRQITIFAHGIRTIMARVSALFWVMRVAAATEPEIAALLQDLLRQRREGMAFFVNALLRTGPLREGLDAEIAADSVWALTSPEVHRLLIVERGWPEDRYEAWLAQTLERTLLP